MVKKPKEFEKTIIFIAGKLKGLQYAFRGTTSIVLQGLDMNVDDIDILADDKSALACNEILKEFLVEKVEYKESDKFKSYFGKFTINDISVEVMGDWQIVDSKRNWSEPFDASEDEVVKVKVEGKEVLVTKVKTELSMYAKMGRWSAYHKLRKQTQ